MPCYSWVMQAVLFSRLDPEAVIHIFLGQDLCWLSTGGCFVHSFPGMHVCTLHIHQLRNKDVSELVPRRNKVSLGASIGIQPTSRILCTFLNKCISNNDLRIFYTNGGKCMGPAAGGGASMMNLCSRNQRPCFWEMLLKVCCITHCSTSRYWLYPQSVSTGGRESCRWKRDINQIGFIVQVEVHVARES